MESEDDDTLFETEERGEKLDFIEVREQPQEVLSSFFDSNAGHERILESGAIPEL
jgi:hypothetical protein